MNIIVCIKQVPASEEIPMNHETGTLIREGVPAMINPFDLYAVEEAINLREEYGGKVVVLSMGPPIAQTAIREAMALGCDEGILLSDKLFAGSDTLATSYTLSCGIRRLERFDLIICGYKTVDGDTGQVGPELAQNLGIPHVSYVCKIHGIRKGWIRVERLLEDSLEIIDSPLPSLLTVVKGINKPRLPSIKSLIRARRVPITIWKGEDVRGDKSRFGLKGSPTRVVRVFPPPSPKKGKIIMGSPRKQAERIVEILKSLN